MGVNNRGMVAVESRQLEILPDRNLHHLAMLPLSFLSEQGDRLAGLHSRRLPGGNDHHLFAASIWAYSLHSYVALVRQHLGDQSAEAMWCLQRQMLEQAEAGAGRSLDSAFVLIDEVLDGGRGRLGNPETRVALALLLGMSESPVNAVEVECELARCLARARNELLAACAGLFPLPHTDPRTPLD